MTPELLAPAGSFEAAVAAFTYGADAVYLGLEHFSARADAANFSEEALRQIVAYARNLPRPRKVYVTLNTLLESREFESLQTPLKLLDRLAIDGVIVQDLGLAAYLRRAFPRIPLHASTQLACTSLAGARALKALGFVRIVTARELGLFEAAEIGRQAGVEIEVFIHGALCYSLSGLCLYSSLATGRSGNRGRCAYCCRQRFQSSAAGHPFSMRDLALAKKGDLLRTLPLASLKIEGRMKNPLYVAAVTDLYRCVLDGGLSSQALAQKEADLRTIFSRPWTQLYTVSQQVPPEAVIDSLCVGHRGVPIGKVLNVLRGTDGLRWLTFDTARALERHDGLQVDLPGRPIGFAVDRLRDARTKRSAITLPAGSRVEVMLPREVSELPRGAAIMCSASQAVRRAFPVPTPRQTELRTLLPADLTLTLTPTAMILSGGGVMRKTPAILAPAKEPARTEEAARKLLSRLGEEGFYLRSLELRNPEGLFLPAALLNATRRAWAEAMRAAQESNATPSAKVRGRLQSPCPTRMPVSPDKVHLSLKVSAQQCPEDFGLVPGQPLPRVTLAGFSLPLTEVVVAVDSETPQETLEQWKRVLPEDSLRWALPVAMRGEEMGAMAARVGSQMDVGARKFECADLGSWQLLNDLQPACGALDITADWTWYAANAEAVVMQGACGLTAGVTSPEENLDNLKTFPTDPPREVLLAQWTPLFISYTRPLADSCALKDREGHTLHVVRQGRLWATLDRRPWRIVDALPELLTAGFSRFRLDVSWAGAALEQMTQGIAPLDALLHRESLPTAFGRHRL